MTGLLDLYAKYKRMRSEPAEISAMIEAEGGEVLERRHVSRFINTPFHGLRTFPLLYEFRVQYGNRRGYWYVRTCCDKGGCDWAWLDLDGGQTLPIANDAVFVTNDVHSVSWLADSVLLFVTIFTATFVTTVIYLMYF